MPAPPVAAVHDELLTTSRGPLKLPVYRPQQATTLGACLYFHGEGWIFNNIDTNDDLVRRLTAVSSCVFVTVDYHRVPEYRFPTATEDAWDALCWLNDHYFKLHPHSLGTASITVASGSAGQTW